MKAKKISFIFKGIVLFYFLESLILLSCVPKKESSNIEERPLYLGESLILKESIEGETLHSFGTIIYSHKVDLIPHVEGRLQDIFVEEGDNIKEGQILGKLENLQLEIQYLKAKKSLFIAEVALKLSQTKYEEAFRHGEAIFLNYEKLDLELEKKEISLKELKRDLENKKTLLELEGVPQEEIHKLEISYKSALLDYKIQKTERDIRHIGYREEDLIQAGYKIPKNKSEEKRLFIEFNNRKLALDVEMAQARVEGARSEIMGLDLLLEELEIRSLQTGILGRKYFEKGERVKKDSKVFTTFSSQEMYIDFPIQEKDAFKVKPNQTLFVTLPALDNKKYKGWIKIISPVIDPKSGNLRVKGVLNNKEELLKPGLYGEVTIDLNRKRRVLCIPEKAFIKRTEKEGVLFLIRRGILFKKECQIESLKEGQVFVAKGVKEGDEVLLNPTPFLKEGECVQTNP